MSTVAAILRRRQTKDHYTFEQWLGFLDHHRLSFGYRYRVEQDTGTECWRTYYDDGYTAHGALIEDCSYD